jgi:hypothetical protein
MSLEKDICVTTEDYNDLFLSLTEQYNKNVVATLSGDEIEVINKTVGLLNDVIMAKGLTGKLSIDREAFINLISRLMPIFQEQSGGMDDNSLTPTKKKTTSVYVYLSDLTSLVGLFVSIFLFYLSFIQLNNMICNATGSSVQELSLYIKEEFDGIREEIKNLTPPEASFFEFLFNALNIFSANIVDKQVLNIQSIISTSINNVVIDITGEVKRVCMPSIVLNDGTLMNSLLNVASSAVSAYSSQTINCMTSTTSILTTQLLSQKTASINILMNQITTNAVQIKTSIMMATVLGYTCASYLILRIKGLYKEMPKIRNGSTVGYIEDSKGGKPLKYKRTKRQHIRSKTVKKSRRPAKSRLYRKSRVSKKYKK